MSYARRYKLNVWDVGGQKTLRSYWRNYFEATDGLVWVVDSADTRRLNDCAEELQNLLVQEVLKLDEITNRHWSIQDCSAVTGSGLTHPLQTALTVSSLTLHLIGLHV
eukprot:762861-Hanusia_phi.AAC.2